MEIRDIPFKALGGIFDKKDADAAIKVINAATEEGGDFFPLPEEGTFQSSFANHEGAKNAIAVNSAGTALDVCMKIANLKEGDEVITTPLSFVCTAGSPAALGSKIIFADVDNKTLNLDPLKVKEKITKKTKMIIPVHLAGLSADIDAFKEISEKYGIPVIYDAAHAVGTKYKGKAVGSAGTASCYSFQSNKNMTCLGEGGMITTNSSEFAEKSRQMKTFGYIYGGPELRVASIGFNYRMTKSQYAVGISQLKKIDDIIYRRLIRMKKMLELLSDIDELILPEGIDEGHGCHLFIVRLDTEKAGFNREKFRNHLKTKYKIGTVVHYPIIWEWEAFNDVDYDSSDCKIALKASRQVTSLPIFPTTKFEDLEYIAWAIKQTISELKDGKG